MSVSNIFLMISSVNPSLYKYNIQFDLLILLIKTVFIISVNHTLENTQQHYSWILNFNWQFVYTFVEFSTICMMVFSNYWNIDTVKAACSTSHHVRCYCHLVQYFDPNMAKIDIFPNLVNLNSSECKFWQLPKCYHIK